MVWGLMLVVCVWCDAGLWVLCMTRWFCGLRSRAGVCGFECCGVFCGGLVVGFVFDGLLILVLVYLLCSIFVVASFALCFVVRLLCLALVGSLDW